MSEHASADRLLTGMSAQQRIEWALEQLPGEHVLTSSFGAQAAVMLHLVSSVRPDIPVVMIDTGYLFPETYRFANELVERLGLDLRVYRPQMSAAWQEANYGRRWEQGADGIADYNRENKVEPKARALEEMNVGTWFAGLRRGQSDSRRDTRFVAESGERFKVHPIADWSDRDVHNYLKEHGLPYHPLWEQGYVSIGDTHTTRSLKEVDSADELRFFGLTRECGLHDMPFGKTA